MIVLKRHIAAVIIVLLAVIIAFFGIKKYESSQTFANRDFKIILDAGHGTFVLCFKNIEFRKRIRKNEPFLYDLSLFIRTSFHIKILDNSVPI